jgi:hypothetical protein
MSVTTCPDNEALALFAEGLTAEPDRTSIIEHFSYCPTCYHVLCATLQTLEAADAGGALEQHLG